MCAEAAARLKIDSTPTSSVDGVELKGENVHDKIEQFLSAQAK